MAEELEELDYYKGRRWGWNDGPNASRATLIALTRQLTVPYWKANLGPLEDKAAACLKKNGGDRDACEAEFEAIEELDEKLVARAQGVCGPLLSLYVAEGLAGEATLPAIAHQFSRCMNYNNLGSAGNPTF